MSAFLDAGIELLAPGGDGEEPIVFSGDLGELPGLLASAQPTDLVEGVEQLVTFARFVKLERGSPQAAEAFLRAVATAAAEPLKRAGQSALATLIGQHGLDAFAGRRVNASAAAQDPVEHDATLDAAVRRTTECALQLIQERLQNMALSDALAELDVDSLELCPQGEPAHLTFRTRDGQAGAQTSPVARALRKLISDRWDLATAVIGHPP